MDDVDCLICLSRSENPSMCAKCSKVFCDGCLQTHFARNGRSCPHCRAPVGQEASGFVNVRWLPELLAAAEKSTNAAAVVADACQSHPSKQLSLYCTECKLSCCVDCTKTDHRNHRLEALEVANDDVRERYESLAGKIEIVNGLVRAHGDNMIKIKKLKLEGERRIAILERDLRKRLEEEVNNLEARLKASCEALKTFINVAPPLIISIESKIKEPPSRNHLVDEASRLDDLTRIINDAINEPAMLIPDSLNIQVSPLWPVPTSAVPPLARPLTPPEIDID